MYIGVFEKPLFPILQAIRCWLHKWCLLILDWSVLSKVPFPISFMQCFCRLFLSFQSAAVHLYPFHLPGERKYSAIQIVWVFDLRILSGDTMRLKLNSTKGNICSDLQLGRGHFLAQPQIVSWGGPKRRKPVLLSTCCTKSTISKHAFQGF